MIRVYHLDSEKLNRDDYLMIAFPLGQDRSMVNVLVQQAWAAGAYTAVADIDTVDLEDAWTKMQNGVVTESWNKVPPEGVTPLVPPSVRNGREYGHRSSMIGDVYQLNGRMNIVASMGFRVVEGITPD